MFVKERKIFYSSNFVIFPMKNNWFNDSFFILTFIYSRYHSKSQTLETSGKTQGHGQTACPNSYSQSNICFSLAWMCRAIEKAEKDETSN